MSTDPSFDLRGAEKMPKTPSIFSLNFSKLNPKPKNYDEISTNIKFDSNSPNTKQKSKLNSYLSRTFSKIKNKVKKNRPTIDRDTSIASTILESTDQFELIDKPIPRNNSSTPKNYDLDRRHTTFEKKVSNFHSNDNSPSKNSSPSNKDKDTDYPRKDTLIEKQYEFYKHNYSSNNSLDKHSRANSNSNSPSHTQYRTHINKELPPLPELKEKEILQKNNSDNSSQKSSSILNSYKFSSSEKSKVLTDVTPGLNSGLSEQENHKNNDELINKDSQSINWSTKSINSDFIDSVSFNNVVKDPSPDTQTYAFDSNNIENSLNSLKKKPSTSTIKCKIATSKIIQNRKRILDLSSSLNHNNQAKCNISIITSNTTSSYATNPPITPTSSIHSRRSSIARTRSNHSFGHTPENKYCRPTTSYHKKSLPLCLTPDTNLSKDSNFTRKSSLSLAIETHSVRNSLYSPKSYAKTSLPNSKYSPRDFNFHRYDAFSVEPNLPRSNNSLKATPSFTNSSINNSSSSTHTFSQNCHNSPSLKQRNLSHLPQNSNDSKSNTIEFDSPESNSFSLSTTSTPTRNSSIPSSSELVELNLSAVPDCPLPNDNPFPFPSIKLPIDLVPAPEIHASIKDQLINCNLTENESDKLINSTLNSTKNANASSSPKAGINNESSDPIFNSKDLKAINNHSNISNVPIQVSDNDSIPIHPHKHKGSTDIVALNLIPDQQSLHLYETENVNSTMLSEISREIAQNSATDTLKSDFVKSKLLHKDHVQNENCIFDTTQSNRSEPRSATRNDSSYSHISELQNTIAEPGTISTEHPAADLKTEFSSCKAEVTEIEAHDTNPTSSGTRNSTTLSKELYTELDNTNYFIEYSIGNSQPETKKSTNLYSSSKADQKHIAQSSPNEHSNAETSLQLQHADEAFDPSFNAENIVDEIINESISQHSPTDPSSSSKADYSNMTNTTSDITPIYETYNAKEENHPENEFKQPTFSIPLTFESKAIVSVEPQESTALPNNSTNSILSTVIDGNSLLNANIPNNTLTDKTADSRFPELEIKESNHDPVDENSLQNELKDNLSEHSAETPENLSNIVENTYLPKQQTQDPHDKKIYDMFNQPNNVGQAELSPLFSNTDINDNDAPLKDTDSDTTPKKLADYGGKSNNISLLSKKSSNDELENPNFITYYRGSSLKVRKPSNPINKIILKSLADSSFSLSDDLVSSADTSSRLNETADPTIAAKSNHTTSKNEISELVASGSHNIIDSESVEDSNISYNSTNFTSSLNNTGVKVDGANYNNTEISVDDCISFEKSHDTTSNPSDYSGENNKINFDSDNVIVNSDISTLSESEINQDSHGNTITTIDSLHHTIVPNSKYPSHFLENSNPKMIPETSIMEPGNTLDTNDDVVAIIGSANTNITNLKLGSSDSDAIYSPNNDISAHTLNSICPGSSTANSEYDSSVSSVNDGTSNSDNSAAGIHDTLKKSLLTPTKNLTSVPVAVIAKDHVIASGSLASVIKSSDNIIDADIINEKSVTDTTNSDSEGIEINSNCTEASASTTGTDNSISISQLNVSNPEKPDLNVENSIVESKRSYSEVLACNLDLKTVKDDSDCGVKSGDTNNKISSTESNSIVLNSKDSNSFNSLNISDKLHAITSGSNILSINDVENTPIKENSAVLADEGDNKINDEVYKSINPSIDESKALVSKIFSYITNITCAKSENNTDKTKLVLALDDSACIPTAENTISEVSATAMKSSIPINNDSFHTSANAKTEISLPLDNVTSISAAKQVEISEKSNARKSVTITEDIALNTNIESNPDTSEAFEATRSFTQMEESDHTSNEDRKNIIDKHPSDLNSSVDSLNISEKTSFYKFEDFSCKDLNNTDQNIDTHVKSDDHTFEHNLPSKISEFNVSDKNLIKNHICDENKSHYTLTDYKSGSDTCISTENCSTELCEHDSCVSQVSNMDEMFEEGMACVLVEPAESQDSKDFDPSTPNVITGKCTSSGTSISSIDTRKLGNTSRHVRFSSEIQTASMENLPSQNSSESDINIEVQNTAESDNNASSAQEELLEVGCTVICNAGKKTAIRFNGVFKNLVGISKLEGSHNLMCNSRVGIRSLFNRL
ncbi:hypothetical protein AYI69_g1591 [Smittium culicis]|uniref:Uncharacterized protein n=1 Tax=Smittium culicis TaxID=133412 RepID=A0A1R1YPT8_9FUNG|nr:hypothetical protein AYI69_g1591 [Smittium culicis]